MNKNIKTTAIHLIGPRAAGKTTYLSTLTYFPQKKFLSNTYQGLNVSYDQGSDAEKLARMAEDIIKPGANLAPSARLNVEDLPYFYLRMNIPTIQGTPAANLEITFRDLAGEIFEDFSIEHKWEKVEPYLDDLFTAPSWMIMLTDWQPGRDTRLYKPAFEKLCQEISEREEINPEIKNLRIAVVMSKCERGEIWPGRLEPDEDLFKVRLPKTYDFLNRRFPEYTNRLKFFACSSFGVLNASREEFDPRPNRQIPDVGAPSEYTAILRDAHKWRPYGLISPIYWLSTGKTLNDPSL
jgi:hypothetical protein